MQFGFLSSIDNLLLPHIINTAIIEGLENIHIILDSKGAADKHRKNFILRTDERFGSYENPWKLLSTLKRVSIPFYFVDNHNSKRSINLYKELNLNCLLNSGTPRIISSDLLNLDNIPNGVVNIHPGILPEYRGCSCVEWAILNDDPIGNTIHFMEDGIDTGPLLETETYNFSSSSSYVDIRCMVYMKGFKLASKALKKIEEENITPKDAQPQDNKRAKYWKPTPSEIEQKAINKANEHRYKYQNIC